MMLEGKPLFFFNQVVREALSEDMNVIRESRGEGGMRHTDIHFIISWWIKATYQVHWERERDIFLEEYNLETTPEM